MPFWIRQRILNFHREQRGHCTFQGSSWSTFRGAHRTSTVSSCAFCEQGGPLAAPFLFLPSFVQFHRGRAPRLLQLRPSNEALRRARVPGAREQCGCPATPLPFSSLYLLLPIVGGGGQMVLDCAHRATTALSWGLCEQEGPSGCSLTPLDPRSSAPVQCPFPRLTPWLSDCFLSVSG